MNSRNPSSASHEQAGKSNGLALDGQGNIFGSAKNGHFFRYSMAGESLQILDLQLPSPKGMEFLNYPDSAVFDGEKAIYGGTTLGTIFRLNTDTLDLLGYGRPLSDHRIRALGIPMVHFPKNWVCYDISALAVGPNGELYIGESERVSYLLIYYPPVIKA
jgi:hypothetical protein